MSEQPVQPPRLNSLDQFRGYTVLGMFLVNFVGGFAAIKQLAPVLRHHHTYLSYADTIMPQFFFAVGFGYRMTFLRRAGKDGPATAYRHAIKRCLGLLVLAFVIHRLDGRYETWSALREKGVWGVVAAGFQREFFQTLAHIAVTSLWVLPVVAARPALRVAYAVGSAALFYGLSEWWYYDWVMTRPGIDGGPLGFLTWTIPTIAGTLAYDAMAPFLAGRAGGSLAVSGRPPVGRLLAAGVALMLVGYCLSCLNRVTPPNNLQTGAGLTQVLIEPPFVAPTEPVNIWTMSQRAGSVTYLTFAAGFALAVFALFVVACDVGTLQVGLLRTLGVNALAGYVLHDLVNEAIHPLAPRDSPLWYVLLATIASIGISFLMLRYLEKHRIFLKL